MGMGECASEAVRGCEALRQWRWRRESRIDCHGARAMRRPARSLCARQAAQRKSITAAARTARAKAVLCGKQMCPAMPCYSLQLVMHPLSAFPPRARQQAPCRSVDMCLSSTQLRDRRHRRGSDFRSNCFPAQPASAVAFALRNHTPTPRNHTALGPDNPGERRNTLGSSV